MLKSYVLQVPDSFCYEDIRAKLNIDIKFYTEVILNGKKHIIIDFPAEKKLEAALTDLKFPTGSSCDLNDKSDSFIQNDKFYIINEYDTNAINSIFDSIVMGGYSITLDETNLFYVCETCNPEDAFHIKTFFKIYFGLYNKVGYKILYKKLDKIQKQIIKVSNFPIKENSGTFFQKFVTHFYDKAVFSVSKAAENKAGFIFAMVESEKRKDIINALDNGDLTIGEKQSKIGVSEYSSLIFKAPH